MQNHTAGLTGIEAANYCCSGTTLRQCATCTNYMSNSQPTNISFVWTLAVLTALLLITDIEHVLRYSVSVGREKHSLDDRGCLTDIRVHIVLK